MEETPVAENILSRGIAAGTGLATTYLSLRNLLDARMMTGVKATAYTLADACMGFLMDICVHVLVGIFVCSDVVEGIEWRLTVYKGIVLVVLERCLSRLAVKRWIVIGKVVVVSCLVYLCMKRYVEIVGKG